jgi:two-component system sensor histidine kinase/response regulator
MMSIKQSHDQRILIVDDTPANVLLLERLLTDRGYKTQSVFSGKLALALARAERFDLILLDISMPDMNGYDVCRQLKADLHLKDIPVIFISALHETIEKVIAFNVGGVDYVTKPFQFEEVLARINTHLQLRWLEKLRDDLTHMLVHDLRNPLTAVFGCLDLLTLLPPKDLSPGIQELVAVARGSAEEMLNMISSILDVSKMGAGEMTLQRELCDLGALIQGVVSASQPLSDNRSVIFDAPVPALKVMVDAILVRRVVQNLLSNAIKYSPTGGVVCIGIQQMQDEVRITVTDTGPGIAAEFHTRIFEKFGQVESKTSRTGTGLGLTFCKLAVEAHGGHIGIESAVGKGSTFWLALPHRSGIPVAA